MSLQRNDMLSTEGRAPRARRSCYVNEPAHGFFVAGSTIKAMNGVYIRRNPPRTEEDDDGGTRNYLLHYEHMDTPWTLSLVETEAKSGDVGPYFGRPIGERSEWAPYLATLPVEYELYIVKIDIRAPARSSHLGWPTSAI